jgi:hypothetical protein
MLWESCSSGYTKHKKIEFAFFEFLHHFILNLQVAAITHKGGKIILHKDPWKDLGAHSYALGLHKTPQKVVRPCNAVLGA